MEITTSSSRKATTSMLEQCNSPRLKSLLGLLLSFALLALPGEASAMRLISGIYENLVIAVDTKGNVVGRYQESQGEGVSKNCSFFLEGKIKSGKASVTTWSDRVLPGVVTAVKGGVELKVANGRDHAGCGLVLLPQISGGMPLDLIQRTKWLDLRRICAVGTMLRAKPFISQEPASPLPKGTTVGVLAEKDGWLLVESTDLETRKRGWIRAGEATRPKPPQTK